MLDDPLLVSKLLVVLQEQILLSVEVVQILLLLLSLLLLPAVDDALDLVLIGAAASHQGQS